MNNKGFTLIELLASIAILALIIMIAVSSVNGISQAVRKNSRNNIIERIEVAASKYAFDTGETIIFVDKLVTEGYIESDDEKGNINDPLNNTRMNCYIVEMKKTSEYYNAKFIDEKNYDVNGVCDISKLKEDSAEVRIILSNSKGTINTISDWLNGNINGSITLKALSDTVNIKCNVNDCLWTSNSGANVAGTDTITLDNITGLLNTKYTFQLTVYDEDNMEVKRYKSSINLKIDNAVPTIYENEITVTNRFDYASSKTVKIVASDGKGSGIKGYYLALDNGQGCNSNSITYSENNSFTVTENGIYLICVKDNVDNTSSATLKITRIE